jgi:4-amino-4-deoxy-L-arabinose transferase-like glycosyltransferase
MKSQKRILVALVACLLCMTTILPWAGAEIIFLPQSSQLIDSAYVYPDPQGSGRVDAVAYIHCYEVADSLGFSYIRLQENRNGTWVTVKSTSSKYAANTKYFQYSITYYGTPGMSYRAQAGFIAIDGSLTETRSSTSETITCD